MNHYTAVLIRTLMRTSSVPTSSLNTNPDPANSESNLLQQGPSRLNRVLLVGVGPRLFSLIPLFPAGPTCLGCCFLYFRPSTKEVLRWAESLEALLTNQCKTHASRLCVQPVLSEGHANMVTCLCWLNSLLPLFLLIRWSGSVSSLPEVRVQRGEPRLLVGCGDIQEDTPPQQDGCQSCETLRRVYFNQCSKTGTCLSVCPLICPMTGHVTSLLSVSRSTWTHLSGNWPIRAWVLALTLPPSRWPRIRFSAWWRRTVTHVSSGPASMHSWPIRAHRWSQSQPVRTELFDTWQPITSG